MNIILVAEPEWPLRRGYRPGFDIYSISPKLPTPGGNSTGIALLPSPHPPGLRTHMGLVKSPDTFLQLLLSPPHTPHLSNFFLEPRFPSQPALMHLPWTQTEVESGVHSVPSTTCSGPGGGEEEWGQLSLMLPKTPPLPWSPAQAHPPSVPARRSNRCRWLGR